MLNPTQQKAVTSTEGNLLLLAGAGSGKTKVIVHRISHLIRDKQILPQSILGLTFTNKAAEEMRSRLSFLISPSIAKQVTLCTFHSFCMTLLRQEIEHLGYTKEFSLYDEGDIRRIVKQLARDQLDLNKDLPSIEPILAKISLARNGSAPLPSEPLTQTLFERLLLSMRACNAVDFDSLLSLTVELFEKHPLVLKKYQDRYLYIMIDEYQDTNPIQYRLAKALAGERRNLCVVGDDDQSIYGWRGADIEQILHFDADITIKLEQNYRSLPTILKAANALISHNEKRHPKTLFSSQKEDELLTLFHAPNEIQEASAVIERMLHLKKTHDLRFCDFAILYRSNTLSRAFETALLQTSWQSKEGFKRGIPYRIFGGTELYERSEIKDVMAYLRLIANPKDEEALLRILNVPRRGISEKTIDLLTQQNRKERKPLWDVLSSPPPILSSKALVAVEGFVSLINEARSLFSTLPMEKALEEFLTIIDYQKAIQEEVKSDTMRQFKWENILSCIESLRTYREESELPSLQDFLATTLLDQRRFGSNPRLLGEDAVNLMTFHSAKGLEFEACFLVGLEDHVVPHERSIAEKRLEEERRLLYVAITRAKKHLCLSMAEKRSRYGKEENSTPSRFLFEIPSEFFRIVPFKFPY